MNLRIHRPLDCRWPQSPLLALALFLLLLNSACATARNGTTTLIKVAGDPAGERIYVDGVPYTTPVELELSNREPHVVHGPDWKSYEISPVPAKAAWSSVWLCIIPPIGLPALFVDAFTSANWTLTPHRIDITTGETTPNENRRDK